MGKEKLSPVKRVKIWMIQNDTNASGIAREYGCTESFISQFLHTQGISYKLVDYLVKKGCPAENFKNGKLAA